MSYPPASPPSAFPCWPPLGCTVDILLGCSELSFHPPYTLHLLKNKVIRNGTFSTLKPVFVFSAYTKPENVKHLWASEAQMNSFQGRELHAPSGTHLKEKWGSRSCGGDAGSVCSCPRRCWGQQPVHATKSTHEEISWQAHHAHFQTAQLG